MRTLLLLTAIALLSMVTSCDQDKTAQILEQQKLEGNCFVAKNDSNKYIYVDGQGKSLFDNSYKYKAGYFYSGRALVNAPDSRQLSIYINEKGEQAFEGTFVTATDFIDGIAFVSEKDSIIKAIDVNGHELFRLPGILEARGFTDGLALVNSFDGRAGFIDKKGQYVVEPIYKSASQYINGLSIVRDTTNMVGAINTRGEYIITPGEYDALAPMYYNDLIVTTKDSKTGLIDRKGATVSEPKYKGILGANGGYMIVLDQDNKAGLLAPDGSVAIAPQYKMIAYQESQMIYAPASKLFVAINDDDKQGVVDASGAVAVPFDYDVIKLYKRDVLIKKDDKWGLCDDHGKVLIEPLYDDLDFFYDGKNAFAVVDKKIVVINRQGQTVCETDITTFAPKRPAWKAVNDHFDSAIYSEQMIKKVQEAINLCADASTITDLITKYNLNEDWLKKRVEGGNTLNKITSGYIGDKVQYNIYITVPTESTAKGVSIATDKPVGQVTTTFDTKGRLSGPAYSLVFANALAKSLKIDKTDKNQWAGEILWHDAAGANVPLLCEIALDGGKVTVTVNQQ